MSEQSGPNTTKSTHMTSVQTTRYYSAWCSVCGVLSHHGYDEQAADSAVRRHEREHADD